MAASKQSVFGDNFVKMTADAEIFAWFFRFQKHQMRHVDLACY